RLGDCARLFAFRSSAPKAAALLLPLDIGRGAGEDLHKMRPGISVAFKTLADGLAQMVECGFGQRRQGTALAAFTALATYTLPPAVDALAQRAQPIKHGVDNLAIGLEVGAAFLGDGVKLL